MEREQADTGIGAGAAKATYNGVFRVLNPSHGAVKGDTPAIVDTGAGISIVNDHHLLDPKTLQETDTTIIGVGGQQKATIKGLAHVVVETLDGQLVRWAFPAVYQPLCPENLIAVRDSDGLNIWNDRGVFHAKFSIVATDGSTRQIKIREHPRIEGVPCVDIRATSRRQRNRPDEEAPKELDVPAVVNINHSMTGVMGAEFQALRTNQLKHASLGHFANGSALRRAVENGSLKITANKEFFDQDQRNRCQQCLLTSRRDKRGITRQRVATSGIAPFAHLKLDFKFLARSVRTPGLPGVLGHGEGNISMITSVPSDENTRPITILLAVDVSTRFSWAAICGSRHEENVAKAMANIITQKDRAAANLRVLTGDLRKGTTVKYSGDDDHTVWAGVRNELAKHRMDLGYGDGEIEAFAQDNNIPYAQAASNGINEANGRTIGTIWRAMIMQSRHIYENPYLMAHAYLHAVSLSNVLPKRDENGDAYTPYNRLCGGTANADVFYPFGTIGYFVDPTKSKLSPDRRVPCLYLGTDIEIPHAMDATTGRPVNHHYQYKVIEWRRLMHSIDIPEPRRTIHAVFMNQEVMPADVTSAFKQYEAELTLRLAPIDDALHAPGEQPHVPRQPMAGARPPPRRADDGRTRSSRELEGSIEPAPSRGGVDDKVMTPVKRKERSKQIIL